MRRNASLNVFRALLARELPSGSAATGIDIGCGEGETTRILHAHGVASVVGVDAHAPSIDAARRGGGDAVTYLHADALDVALPQADVVTSVAMLHHVDMVEGLRAMASLVAPGGLLLVVGLAKSTYPRDLLHDLAGSVAVRLHRQWQTTAPILWPPPVTYAEARRVADDVLPGVRYRREIQFRYTLTWRPALVETARGTRDRSIAPSRRSAAAPRAAYALCETDRCDDGGMQVIHQVVVFDAADLAAESGFWAGVLGGSVDAEDDWHMVLVDGRPRVGVQLAPNHVPPDWPHGTPQQIHLDLWVDDPAAAHERVMALGAKVLKEAEDGSSPDAFQVYADPAGHPFCVCWVKPRTA